MIFDTHAHYDDEAFDEDRAELLSCVAAQGIAKIVNIGSSFEANEKTLKLAQEYDFIKAAFGLHPEFADQLNEENFKRIEELSECLYFSSCCCGFLTDFGSFICVTFKRFNKNLRCHPFIL